MRRKLSAPDKSALLQQPFCFRLEWQNHSSIFVKLLCLHDHKQNAKYVVSLVEDADGPRFFRVKSAIIPPLLSLALSS
jgi:hypothetical protein